MTILSRIPFCQGRISRGALGRGLIWTFGTMSLLAFAQETVAVVFPEAESLNQAASLGIKALAYGAWAYVLSLFVRRLHDSGTSGVWVPLFCGPLLLADHLGDAYPLACAAVAVLVYVVGLEAIFEKGEPRENIYGPVPA